jgi:hypothetical protein
MRIARIAAFAAVLVGTVMSSPMGAMAGPKRSAIFVANTYNVLAFPTGSHGNVAPIALNTDMADPFGIARDKSGRIYVSNSATNTVTVYPANADGNVPPIAVIAGSNTGLASPTRIALDDSQKIYVLNAAEHFQAINVYPQLGTSTGILNEAPVARIAGSKTLLSYPYGIAFDSDQNIYVANASGGPIVPHEIFDVGSVTVYPAGSSGNLAPMAVISGAQTGLALPFGIAVDPEGKIYVGNFNTANTQDRGFNLAHSSITVYSPGSKGNVAPIATIAGINTSLIDLEDIALDSLGNLYAAGCGDVYCFTINSYSSGSNGNVAPAATIFGVDTGLVLPVAMTLDSDRNLYALSNEGGPAGEGFVTVYPADSNGDTPPISKITSNFDWLDGASAVAVDSAGKIYVASEFSGDPNGSISIFPAGSYASGGPPIATITGPDTELSRPYGIALDSAGNLFVLNDTEEVTEYPAGSVGDATPTAIFDIELRTDSTPTGIAVNTRGKLYITFGSTVKCNRRSCRQGSLGSIMVYPAGSDGNGNPSGMISGPNTKLESPSAIAVARNGNVYVANQGPSLCKPGCECLPNGSGSITVYGPNSNGNTAPIATISGANTGLTFPDGITFDSSGKMYVTIAPPPIGFCASFAKLSAPAEGAILIFAPGSTGNVAPIGSIKGPVTGLNNPLGIAIGPSGH